MIVRSAFLEGTVAEADRVAFDAQLAGPVVDAIRTYPGILDVQLRRLVQAETLAEFVRVLKPGGRFRFVTDWKDYAAWTLERALRQPGLKWLAGRADDWRTPPADHVTTRYEEKKLGDTPPIYLDFDRL